jgi:hypothetical protein
MSSTIAVKVIRGGRVLDIRSHRADPADVLIEGNRLVELY